MSIHPSASFPLLASDQSDVIRIFLDLMCENGRAGAEQEAAANKAHAPHNDSDRR